MQSIQVFNVTMEALKQMDSTITSALVFLMDWFGLAGFAIWALLTFLMGFSFIILAIRSCWFLASLFRKGKKEATGKLMWPMRLLYAIVDFVNGKGPWIPKPDDCNGPWKFEGEIKGSLFLDRPMPKFQFQVQYMDILGGWQLSGMGCRVGDKLSDFLMMPQHILKKTGHMRLVTPGGAVFNLQHKGALMQPGFDPILIPTPDEVKSSGLTKAGIGALPSKKSVMVSVVGPSGYTMGKLTEYDTHGMVKYGASTVAGCSGAPYHDNKTVYGVHIGQYDEDNVGWDASYVFARLIKLEKGDYDTYWGDRIIQARKEGVDFTELDNGDIVLKYGGKYRRFDKEFYNNVLAQYDTYVNDKIRSFYDTGDWAEDVEAVDPSYKVRRDRKRGRPTIHLESAPPAVPPLQQAVHVDHDLEDGAVPENSRTPASAQGVTRAALNHVYNPAQLNALATQPLSFLNRPPPSLPRPSTTGPAQIPVPRSAPSPTTSPLPSTPAEILRSLLPPPKPQQPLQKKQQLPRKERMEVRRQFFLEHLQMSPDALNELKSRLEKDVNAATTAYLTTRSNESLTELQSASEKRDLFQAQLQSVQGMWSEYSATL